MDWKGVAVLLGVYGFFKEFRPSEPFVTAFLTGPDKNFTAEQVNQEIFPVSSYANVLLLIAVFLVTDWLRYKPVLVVQALTGIVLYSMLVWGQGILIMQIMEVLYGLMMASDVSYFTYMFAKVGREHFNDVAASSRVGFLLGRFSSGVVSQVVVSCWALPLMQLQYFTLGALAVSALLAVILPAVETSIYFHKNVEGGERPGPGPGPALTPGSPSVARLLWSDFRDAYSQTYVLRWSLWWALANAGQVQVLSFVQILWQKTLEESGQGDAVLWNGAVEALYTLLGAGAAWLATRCRSYKVWGDLVLAAWSLVAGGLIIAAASSSSILLQYCLYTVFGVMYHGAITVASSEVAQHVRDDAQALVFGFNSFIAMLVQTVLTLAVAAKGSLELGIRAQFYVYGGYFLVIGAAFSVTAMVTLWTRRRRGSESS